jgi:hypothetical protein
MSPLSIPAGSPASGRLSPAGTREIIVDFQLLDVSWQLKGDYFNDPDFKEQVLRVAQSAVAGKRPQSKVISHQRTMLIS